MPTAEKLLSVNELTEHFLEMIRRSSTSLPEDVKATIKRAAENEDEGSAAKSTLLQLLDNVALAESQATPVCQDTGALIFLVDYSPEYRMKELRQAIEQATVAATERYYLRSNAVDSVNGKNSGNNLGDGAPFIHFEECDEPGIHVRLLQKGGGSENVSAQYKLPDSKLSAGRDLEGVRRVVLDAVCQAQGLGCAPGILGIGIGGDRATSFLCAKEQLCRKLDDVNPREELAELEQTLLSQANELGIGPMGFGGKTTVLAVKAGARHRLPASFFVSIAYMCWALRRCGLKVDEKGTVTYHD